MSDIIDESHIIAPVRVNPVLLHPGERRVKLDGEEIATSEPGGNGNSPFSREDFISTVKISKGSHLLVERFCRGSTASVLMVCCQALPPSPAEEVLLLYIPHCG